MGKIDELDAKITELQEALAQEKQEIADRDAAQRDQITALEQAVADLTALLGGVSDAHIQAEIDKVNAVIADLKATVEPAA